MEEPTKELTSAELLNQQIRREQRATRAFEALERIACTARVALGSDKHITKDLLLADIAFLAKEGLSD